MDIFKNIQETLRQRKIEELVHFTQAENLESILKLGLIPRDKLAKGTFKYNDEFRYDTYDSSNQGVCLSLSFPNYKLFYKFRRKGDNKNKDWVVLGIDPNILLKTNCRFFKTNAAKCADRYKIKKSSPTEIFTRGYPDEIIFTLEDLFAENPSKPTRSEMGIPDDYPTDPQAEILVFETISPEYIKGIAFDNNDTYSKYKEICDNYKEIIHGVSWQLFSQRNDYKHW